MYNEVLIEKANILIEALPYIQRLAGKTVVIKYGGNAMVDEDLTNKILQDVTLLKYVGVNPILVHGGGPDINAALQKMDVKSEFHNGLRITDEATMEVVQMVLAGKLNKNIVSRLGKLGGKAIGLCGKDAGLLTVVKKPLTKDGVDLGFVGNIVGVNVKLLELLSMDEYIPVIAPVGVDRDGKSYNINADTAASEIASALKAEKLMFLTDVDGIRLNAKDSSTLISSISVSEINELISSGVITGGMIPKVQGCVRAIEQGVKRVHILDGTIPPEKERKYLQIISDESRRLSRLVRRMLDISQIQSQQDMKKEDFDLCESMRLALLSMEQKITDRGLDVEADIPEDSVMVQGVNDLITQVIYNLLENAAKFAAPGSTLYLGLTETGGDKAVVTVRNTGHTIPAEEIPLLFERFHKSDKSRSEDKDGYGLGLYVVKTILSQHKEKITVTSENGVTSFSFTVQLAHPMRNT